MFKYISQCKIASFLPEHLQTLIASVPKGCKFSRVTEKIGVGLNTYFCPCIILLFNMLLSPIVGKVINPVCKSNGYILCYLLLIFLFSQ